MSIKNGWIYICALSLFMLTGKLQAKDRHYADLYAWAQGVQWINSQPDRSYVEAFIQVRSRRPEVPIENIRLLIHASGGDMVLPLPSSGVLDLPINGALIAENPAVEFSDKVAVSVAVRASASPRQSFDYKLIHDMVSEYYRTVGHQNFLPAQFRSAHVRGLALRDEDGNTDVKSTCRFKLERRDGIVVIVYDEKVSTDCVVTLSRLPSSMELVFKWF